MRTEQINDTSGRSRMMETVMQWCALSSPMVSDVKVDSRYLLPMEALIGVQMIVFALIGDILASDFGLYALLQDNAMTDDWLLLLLPVGIAQCWLAVFVMCRGRDWAKHHIFMSVSLRTMTAAAGIVMWAASAATLVSIVGVRAGPFVLLALTGIAANAWSFYINWQARTLLDERIPTTNLLARVTHRR